MYTFLRLPALAFTITLMSPVNLYAHCDEIEHAGNHPHCSDGGSGGTNGVILSRSNKVTSIHTEAPMLTLPKQCSLDDRPCVNDLDCAGALNFCVPGAVSGESIDSTLLISVATRINTVCEIDGAVVIALDAITPVELVEQRLMQQVLETALAGPFRIKFWIEKDQCKTVLGSEYPVATSIQLIQNKF